MTDDRALTTFTTSLAGIPEPDRDAALDDLARAMHAEFPAFVVTATVTVNDEALVTVRAFPGTPRAAFCRLHDWGHGRLSLTRPHDEPARHP